MTITAHAPVDPMLPHPYVVREVAKETSDTFTLTLESAKEANGRSFLPGQFSMLWVFGVVLWKASATSVVFGRCAFCRRERL